MTDIKDQLARLLADEPPAPDDLERIVTSGRRARRRRQLVVATASTVGVAGLSAAVAVPVALTGGGGKDAVNVAVRPSPTASPSATTGNCYLISAKPKDAKLTLARLLRSGKVGDDPSVKNVQTQSDGRTIMEVCAAGASASQPNADAAEQPKGPPYKYDEKPDAIAARLGSHLHDRVAGFGLTITYTRPFSQESSNMDAGHPSYYGGNVDVHENDGYADIGVQVTHETTEQVPFTGACTASDNCEESTMDDGSVLRTAQVKAGRGDTVITAEVHRPDGTVVQAQMSNYPFGPDAGTQPHGDQPLSLKQLISLAQDADFAF